MARYVTWYVGPVGFDRLNDAITHRRTPDGLEPIELVFSPTEAKPRPDKPDKPAVRRSPRRKAATTEVESKLRAALIESGYTPHQAETAIAEARERKVRKVRKVR